MPSLRSSLLAIVAATLAPASLKAQPPTGPLVRAPAGALRGSESDGIDTFKAIPYAKPPVGPLRWRAPQPLPAWTGVRDATQWGANCMQRNPKDPGLGPGPMSEDCLLLNIFEPAQRKAPLPVMVWIHGGGFTQGAGAAALFNGTELAKQGVIVVTINYRLGHFGFFAHPALTAEAKGGPVANYGLMDQIAALKWVRANISAFGGDPHNVTIAGESAGGMSVNALMISPLARGLFEKGITESGVGREQPEPLAKAEKQGEAFAASLGATHATAASLRALPADKIASAPDADLLSGELPIADGKVVPTNVLTGFEAGRDASVPFLIGSNDLELPKPWVPATLFQRFHITPEKKAELVKLYGSQEAFDTYFPTDLLFGEPARHLALLHSKRAPTFLYRFGILSAQAPSIIRGTPHGGEQAYVFKTLKSSPWPTGQRDIDLMQAVSAYWVAFIKTGNPNGDDRPRWPQFNGTDIMRFTNDGPQPGPDPEKARLAMLSSLYASGDASLDMGPLAVSAKPAAAAPATPAYTGPLTTKTPVGVLASIPAARAILDQQFPGLTTHPLFASFKGMSLEELAPLSGGIVTTDKLKVVAAELAKLPPVTGAAAK